MENTFTLEKLLTKIELLNKPYWFASDIKDYLDCSMVRAVNLKNMVANEIGVIPEHRDDKQRAVKADDVIKAIGGNSRLEELEILQKSMEILKMKGKQ